MLVLSGYMSSTQFLMYRITRREQQKITNLDFANNLNSFFPLSKCELSKNLRIFLHSDQSLYLLYVFIDIFVHICEY